jgi:PPK2 family polyphosphate:nucleotide phosphotransferase
VPFDGSFEIGAAPTAPPRGAPGKKDAKRRLEELTQELSELQRILWAQDDHAVLLIFQAMDAAGKDGTIRAVLTGVNPAGCEVYSFKQPSSLELDHDFLWRTARRLPERGRIGVFNRSYYEEVLVVRVHPGILDSQKLPGPKPAGGSDLEALWQQRFESIREHEHHLARNGTVILKFFLHVSKDEQRERFLARLDEPHKNWKFSAGDVRERGHWDAYQHAYQEALRATSRPWAPWYAIPADDKAFLRMHVAEIVTETLRGLGLRWPEVSPEEKARFDEMRAILASES